MEDDAVHLSRHLLRLQAQHVVMLPGPMPGPADTEGNILIYKLFAVGGWVEDVQEEHLAIMALAVTKGPGGIASVIPRRLASWRHPGSVTALQVSSFGSGEVCIFSGSSTGALCRLQLSMPTAPGATPADIQLRAGGFEGADLQPVVRNHRGAVSGLAVQDDCRQVATCGLDGRIFILPALGDLSAAAPVPLVDRGATASFWAVAWTSPQTLATAGTTGGLEIWDARSAASPLLSRSPLSWGATGFAKLDAEQGCRRTITCLAVHPGRPHMAATGSSDGTVAVWDLRFSTPPAQCSLNDRTAGNVRKVQFDVSDASVSGACLLFCTQGGVLAVATPADPHRDMTLTATDSNVDSCWEARMLWRESCTAMLGFDAEQEQGRDLIATTDQEMLVYLAR